MTLLELKAYFEQYAEKHVELRHDPADKDKWAFFCLGTEDNTNEFIRNCKMDLFMVLMPYHQAMNKTSSNNYTWNKFVAFMVLKRVNKKVQADIIDAYNQCEQIGNDFVTRLIDDRHNQITTIEDGSFASEPIGPMGDNFYGQIFMFTGIDWFDQRVNAERWLP